MPLNYQTVTPLLKSTLETLMAEPLFAPFLLVGGTNLSLRFGHRLSDDIDMFTDAEYRSLDYQAFEKYLKERFPYFTAPIILQSSASAGGIMWVIPVRIL